MEDTRQLAAASRLVPHLNVYGPGALLLMALQQAQPCRLPALPQRSQEVGGLASMSRLAGQHAEAQGELVQQAKLQAGIGSHPQKAAAQPRDEVQHL